MTAIAEELDRKLRGLDPARAAECERMVRQVLDSMEGPALSPASPPNFITRTHDFGFDASVDLTKLNHLSDES